MPQATDVRDVVVRSAANSPLASADSPSPLMKLAGPSRSPSGAAADSPEPVAACQWQCMSTALPMSLTSAEGSAASVPQAADVQETPNYAGQAQQVLQETGTFSILY